MSAPRNLTAHIDRDTTFDEVWEATERLVADGKVTYAGTGNFAGWHMAAAAESASHRHFLGPVSEQSAVAANTNRYRRETNLPGHALVSVHQRHPAEL
jgi:aryl-alcohol dehydrogenase-like predicted oxidoreductase